MCVILDRKKADARKVKFLADLSAKSAENMRQQKVREAQILREIQAKDQAELLIEQELNNMTRETATMLAKAIDAQNVRRKFIENHLSDLPATYSESLPDTGNLTELHSAAKTIRQQFETEFVPLQKKFQEQEALRLDGERRAQAKAKYLANGMSDGEAEFASQMRLVGTEPMDRAAEELREAEKSRQIDAAVTSGSITPGDAVFAKSIKMSA